MNLVIDIGNSSAKLAIFKDQKKLIQKTEVSLTRNKVDYLLDKYEEYQLEELQELMIALPCPGSYQ